ncbi:MAG: hypothetical protein CL581_18680 [Alteromonadaceae bacterium]|nr:hypothetical protein [Alteromonadaceae bacterium]
MEEIYAKNLKEEWKRFKNKNGKTQTSVSIELGWAEATLGLYVSGQRALSLQHAIDLAALFDCDVRKLYPTPDNVTREYPVSFTVSGNPSPHPTKKLRQTAGTTVCFCDVDLWIEGAALAVPAGATMIIQPPEAITNDPLWPTMGSRYWVIHSTKRNARMILSPERPQITKDETLYHLLGTIFV